MGDFAGGLLLARELIPPGSTVLCAVSGGADSVCLLHQLYRLRREVPFTLAAAHYNHQLRGEEADRDAAFVRQFITLCCGRDRLLQPDGTWRDLPPVELFIGGGDVSGEARRRRRGVEETARDMRYDFLRRTARTCGAQWIATAHNAGDNAETILLHLIRGTGLRGLGGISPRQGDVIRPLLSVSRDEIEAYLRFWGLPWREDATNRDDAYTRNRLRHRVLPELEAISPGLTVRLGEMSRLRADEAYLVEQAQASLAPLEEIPGGLSLPAESVAALPQPLAVRAARILLGRMEGGNENCSAAHLEGLIALCRSGDPSAELNLPGGVTAHRAPDLDTLRPSGGTGKSSPAAPAGHGGVGGLDGTQHPGALPGAAAGAPSVLAGPGRGPCSDPAGPSDRGPAEAAGPPHQDRQKMVRGSEDPRLAPPGASSAGLRRLSGRGGRPGTGRRSAPPARSARVAHPADPAPGISKLGRAGAIRPAIHSAAVIVRKGRSIMLEKDIQEILFSEEQLASRVNEIARQITQDYQGKEIVLISVLRGSFVFMADLCRRIDLPCTVDFMAVSSYGSGTSSTGQVQITKDLSSDIAGKHIIVVEDILDSGNTLSYLLKLLAQRKPASIRLCTLLDKPERRTKPVEVHYSGFTIPDAFVVGYGLDYAEHYRNLPYIGILKPEVYGG